MFKQPLFILLLMFLLPVEHIAQDRVKGPQAKNFKAWEREAKIAAKIAENRLEYMGPKAKNKKVWEGEPADQNHVTIEVAAENNQLHGVRVKNAKVWEDSNAVNHRRIPRFITPVLILLILGL
ncbi:hypothetical protein JMN32_02035 [Fulvivirga sp. 29W222]|uniref:Uncharacterized protein n=1 Tax=Fulvivirga marina TaxID=2494733 RepID=A0A937KCB4_9BACT|nr:hypothetical protein [Fulvivirga marina]MBL6445068.1 hypothetical protein [Fulvivirga marina]